MIQIEYSNRPWTNCTLLSISHDAGMRYEHQCISSLQFAFFSLDCHLPNLSDSGKKVYFYFLTFL